MEQQKVTYKQGWFTRLLCKTFSYKEIGWKDIGETFYRWTLFTFRGYKIFLHKLDAPNWHPQCHDHPWDFWAFIIWPGYWEKLDPKQKLKNTGQHCGGNVYWRRPLTILYRPAASKHNVITPIGTPNWSLVIVTPKKRGWGMLDCD